MISHNGHTLLSEALRVINRAVDAHHDASRCREIVARTSVPRGPVLFGVGLYAGDPERIVDRYTIQVHEGRFQVIGQGDSELAIDWRVTADGLRRIVAKPDCYVRDPGGLPLAWLESRLGIREEPKRAPSPSALVPRQELAACNGESQDLAGPASG